VDSEQTEVGAKPDDGGEPRVRVRGAKGQLHLEIAFGDATFAADGDADTVLRAFEAFKDHDATHHRHRAPAKAPVEPPHADDGVSTNGQGQQQEELPLPAFLNQFRLETKKEVAVAIAVWASRQPNGPKQFKTPSMEKLWATSGQKPPANVSAELDRATKEGWFNRVSRGTFDLVGYGATFVDEKLPRAVAKK
jgi:hypothetical protein